MTNPASFVLYPTAPSSKWTEVVDVESSVSGQKSHTRESV